MGQTESAPVGPTTTHARVAKLARGLLNGMDLYTLEKEKINEENLPEILGIEGRRGSHVFLRVAQFFASYPLSMDRQASIASNLPQVIGFLNGKLVDKLGISQDSFVRLLFLSIAVINLPKDVADDKSEIDLLEVPLDQYYVAYQDLLDLWALLVSVFDKFPYEKFTIDVTQDDVRTAEKLIRAVKAPTIPFERFEMLLRLYPSITASLGIIMEQVLYPERKDPEERRELPDIPRSALCELFFALGPRIFTAIKLYRGSESGFSMRSFEGKVFKWRAPSILLVRGRPLKTRSSELDSLYPPIHDAEMRKVKSVVYAAYVASPWKMSVKSCFADADTKLIQLAPDFNVYKATKSTETAFFAPKVGIGFGITPPQDHAGKRTSQVGNVSLMLDSSFEHGVFRQLGQGGTYAIALLPANQEPYEDRFIVDQVEVWGLGSATDLDDQRKAWEWDERESKRRQNINIGEDRAILEMAGIVGQYTDRRE